MPCNRRPTNITSDIRSGRSGDEETSPLLMTCTTMLAGSAIYPSCAWQGRGQDRSRPANGQRSTSRVVPWRGLPIGVAVSCMILLFGCAQAPSSRLEFGHSPAEDTALISRMLPSGLQDRAGWSADIYAAFAVQDLEVSIRNICATVAVIEQESGFRVDPVVPGLPKTAWAEIDRRAERAGVPVLVVHAALQLNSSDGHSYAERLDAVRTEKQLSDIFKDLIGRVPLGNRLFAGLNPIRTRGPMQVNVAFAERYSSRPYPYPVKVSVEDELFTRRGGLFFGIAHLLGYHAPYDRYLFRFADFNAGQYASRNAAFQEAISHASGIPLVSDGALIAHSDDAQQGSTELAARVAARRIALSDTDVRRALELGRSQDLEKTPLYERVFELADRYDGRPLPRATLPRIDLHGPKITRHLTTEWYANSVDARFKRCLKRSG